jgi:hypothetical protein
LSRLAALIFLSLCVHLQLYAEETPAAPYCVAANLENQQVLVSWHYPGVNTELLFHDQNEIDDYFLVSEQQGDNRAAVVYGNVNSEAAWESIEIFLWGVDQFPELAGGPTSPFRLEIHSSQPDQFATRAWSVVTEADSVAETGVWLEIPVREKLDLSDSAWLEFHWLAETPTAPLLGVDFQQGGATHSYFARVETDEIQWLPNYGNEFLIRANLTRPDTGAGGEAVGSVPDSFTLYLAAGPESQDTTRITVTESLHCFLDAAEMGGRFVEISAWLNGHEGDRSPSQQLPFLNILPPPLEFEPDRLEINLLSDQIEVTWLTLTNTWHDTVRCFLSFDTLNVSWMQVAEMALLPPDESRDLELELDSYGLPWGSYSACINLSCTANGAYFSDTSFSITLEIDEPTAVAEGPLPELSALELSQNHPNPFNSETQIFSNSAEPIAIFDLMGRQVAELQVRGIAGERFHFTWGGLNCAGAPVASGIYLYRQQGTPTTRKMLLIK